MKLVLDANILISGLLKNGITRAIMLSDKFDLYTSNFIFLEFLNHIKELSKKAKMSKEELKDLAETLIVESELKTISKNQVKGFIDTANKISPDIDDALYFAVALRIDCAIWSNDNELKNQKIVKVYSTKDIIKILKNY